MEKTVDDELYDQEAAEEEEEEESLSFTDLPLIPDTIQRKESPAFSGIQNSEDFDFGPFSGAGDEMCSADEVFFQGRILPFRHSVGSRISRSHSLVSTTTTSSNSSGNRNLFLSHHPSPSPRIRSTANVRRNNPPQKPSSLWNIFRLGPPPQTTSRPQFPAMKIRANFLPGCRYCPVDGHAMASSKPAIFRRSASASDADALKNSSAKKRQSHRRTFEWLKQLP